MADTKLDTARTMLHVYDKLERKECSKVYWLCLKMGCTTAQAEKWIAAIGDRQGTRIPVTGATHTVGPWRVGDAGRTIFGPPNGSPSPETIANVRHRRNARVLALAPEMYSALLDAEAYCPVHVQDRIRALIGRAHG